MERPGGGRARPGRTWVVLGVLVWSLAWWAGSVLVPAPGSHPALAQTSDPPGYAPWLLWIEGLSRVPAPERTSLRVHARLPGDGALVSAMPQEIPELAASGVPLQVLARDTRGQVLYLVDRETCSRACLTSPSSPGPTWALLHDVGAWALVAVDRTAEARFVAEMLRRGAAISLVDPLPLPPWTLMPEAVETPLDLRFQAQEPPDPQVDALLRQVTPETLRPWIQVLSGQEPAPLPGGPVTLATRYTLSSRIRDAERYLYTAIQEMGLEPVYVPWVYGNFSGRNLVVDLPGTLYPERIWLVGGHFDTNSEIPYTAAPGADDNGTGVAATLVLLQILKEQRLAETVRFVFFSGEEQGQWGSKRYARELSLAGAQVRGYIDLDMIGFDGDGDRVVELHTGTGAQSNELGTALMAASERYGLDLVFERKDTTASRFSDHSAFWDYNYPAVLVIENFFTDARPRDRNPHYHTSNDRVDALDLDYTARIARMALAALADLAGLQPFPGSPTPTPSATPTQPSPTTTPTPTSDSPPGCENRVANGGFEELAEPVWRFGNTPYPAAIVAGPVVHTGARSLRLGIPVAGDNRLAHSSAFQPVALPGDVDDVRLVLAVWDGGQGDGVDYREVLLLDAGYGYLATLGRDGASGSERWRVLEYDLTAYRGRTVVLYLNVYNDGRNSHLWRYVDDVAVWSCRPVTPTPTPTATPTPTSPATVTPSPTPWPTSPPTPTPAYRGYLPWVRGN